MKDVDVLYPSVVLGDCNNNEYTESYVKRTFFLLKLRNNSMWKVIRFFIVSIHVLRLFFKVDDFYFALLVAEVIPSLLAACEVFEDF